MVTDLWTKIKVIKILYIEKFQIALAKNKLFAHSLCPYTNGEWYKIYVSKAYRVYVFLLKNSNPKR